MTIKRVLIFLFHRQSFLLIPIVISLCYTFVGLSRYSQRTVIHTGKLISIDRAEKNLRDLSKSADKRYSYVTLGINTSGKLFKVLISPNSRANSYIVSHIHLGDTVVLYSKSESLIRRSNFNMVDKLLHRGNIIVDYSKLTQKVNFNITLISMPFLIGFSALYIVKARRRYRVIKG